MIEHTLDPLEDTNRKTRSNPRKPITRRIYKVKRIIPNRKLYVHRSTPAGLSNKSPTSTSRLTTSAP